MNNIIWGHGSAYGDGGIWGTMYIDASGGEGIYSSGTVTGWGSASGWGNLYGVEMCGYISGKGKCQY